jgi:hypothetical protein
LAAGYAVPPIPEGAELDALIGRRWQMLPMHEWELPENAPRHGIWLSRLQWERQAKLGEFASPHVGRYNVVGRRVWWQNGDVDDVVREHGYVPPSYQRTLCADADNVAELILGWAFCDAFRGALRALPTTSRRITSIVIGMPGGLHRRLAATRKGGAGGGVGADHAGAPRGDPSMVGRGPGDAGKALPPPR